MGGPSSRHARALPPRPHAANAGRLWATSHLGLHRRARGGSGLARWGGERRVRRVGRAIMPGGGRGATHTAAVAADPPRRKQPGSRGLFNTPRERCVGGRMRVREEQQHFKNVLGGTATRRLPRRAVCRAAQAAPRVPRAVVIPCHVNPVRPAHAGPCEAREGGGEGGARAARAGRLISYCCARPPSDAPPPRPLGSPRHSGGAPKAGKGKGVDSSEPESRAARRRLAGGGTRVEREGRQRAANGVDPFGEVRARLALSLCGLLWAQRVPVHGWGSAPERCPGVCVRERALG